MNYKAIVFIGFNEPSSKKNIKDYFKRQYENAKKENYSLDEFFDGCMDAVRKFEGFFDDRFTEHKNQFFQKFDYETELNRIKADPNRDDVMKKWSVELRNLEKKKESLSINAANVINPYKDYNLKGLIKYSDLEQWKTTIEDVKLSLQSKNDDVPSKIEPLDFNLTMTNVVHFFDLLVDADIMREPSHDAHNSKGGFYGKLSQYFTAKGKSINSDSAKQVKFNKGHNELDYSESYYIMLEDLQRSIGKKLKNSKKN